MVQIAADEHQTVDCCVLILCAPVLVLGTNIEGDITVTNGTIELTRLYFQGKKCVLKWEFDS